MSTDNTSTVWFTPREAAAATKLSVPTIRREVRAGRLRAYRVGAGQRLLRFRQADLVAWVESHEVKEAA